MYAIRSYYEPSGKRIGKSRAPEESESKKKEFSPRKFEKKSFVRAKKETSQGRGPATKTLNAEGMRNNFV